MATASAATGRVFRGKDATKQTVTILAIVSVVIVLALWKEIAALGTLGIGAVTLILALIWLTALSLLRRNRQKELVVNGSTVVVRTGRNEQVLLAEQIARLVEKDLRPGRGSYLQYTAVMHDGAKIPLFTNGSMESEEELKSALQLMCGKQWERQ